MRVLIKGLWLSFNRIDLTSKMRSVIPTDKVFKCLRILQLNGFHGYEVSLTGWHHCPDCTSFHVRLICTIQRQDPSTCTSIQTDEGQGSSPSLDWQQRLWETTFTQLLPKPLSETNIPRAICTPALVLIETDTSAARAG